MSITTKIQIKRNSRFGYLMDSLVCVSFNLRKTTKNKFKCKKMNIRNDSGNLPICLLRIAIDSINGNLGVTLSNDIKETFKLS